MHYQTEMLADVQGAFITQEKLKEKKYVTHVNVSHNNQNAKWFNGYKQR